MDSCNSLESINSSDNCPDSFEQPVVKIEKETKVNNQVKLLWIFFYNLYKKKQFLIFKQLFVKNNNSLFYKEELIFKHFKRLKSLLITNRTANIVFISCV